MNNLNSLERKGLMFMKEFSLHILRMTWEKLRRISEWHSTNLPSLQMKTTSPGVEKYPPSISSLSEESLAIFFLFFHRNSRSIFGGKISESVNAHGLHTDFHLRKVPAWAEEKALKRSLRISEKVVPESIFAEPSPPNLQDIFPSTLTSRGDLYRSPVRPLSDLMKTPNQQPSSLFSKAKGI